MGDGRTTVSLQKISSHLLLQDPSYDYPVVERGEGIYLYDVLGKRYIDGTAGAGNVILGHGQGRIAQIMARQAETLAYCFTAHFANPVAADLATQLARLAPGDLNHAYFVSGGSEGIETALKIARLYHLHQGQGQKHQVISRWNSYHGATLGALALTGSGVRKPFTPWLSSSTHIEPFNPRNCPFEGCQAICSLACAKELERAILRAGPENVAAFVAEPIVIGSGPINVPPPDYFLQIREICDRYNVLFIADEVVTGFGRTGRLFAIQHWDVVPDILVFGKGVSSGYFPMGGVLFKDEIREVVEIKGNGFPHVFTYVNNPLAARIGLTVLDLLEKERLIAHSAAMGEYLLEKSQSLRTHSIVGDICGKGLLLGIDLVASRDPYTPLIPSFKAHQKLHLTLMQRGLSVSAGGGSGDGSAGDNIRFFPPLVITREQIDESLEILDEGLHELEHNLSITS